MNTYKYIISIGIAAGAGLAIGILTAPRKGKQTRTRILNDLNNTRSELETAASRKLNEAREILNNSLNTHYEKGKKSSNKIKESVLDNA